MDLSRRSIALCVEGTEAELHGRVDDARRLYRQSWDEAVDDYDRTVAAHYIAHLETDPAEQLRWNQSRSTTLGALMRLQSLRSWARPTSTWGTHSRSSATRFSHGTTTTTSPLSTASFTSRSEFVERHPRHAPAEMSRRGERYGIVSMCSAGGMRAAAVRESRATTPKMTPFTSSQGAC